MKSDHNDNINDLVIYQSQDGALSFNVTIFEESVWLTQEQIGNLFGKARSTITEHINNIFKERELKKEAVCRDFRHVTQHGAVKGLQRSISVQYYNLDVIISVGYRVKSPRGTQFRIWATNVSKQYMLNGYAVNEVRIKQIESCINDLVKSDKIQRAEISEIKDLLKRLLDRPVIFNSYHEIKIPIL